jgi:single-strand DNA-binding protein
MPDNSVTLVGNVTREPELRYTAAGQAMAKFGLAVNRRWQNRQTNAWEESTSFFDVVAWREMAENVGESTTKGTRVVVTGRMEQRSYENQAGEKRSAVELVADEIGPSLRWATAQVQKNDRRGPSDGGGQPMNGGYRPVANATPSSGGPAPTYDYGDEPF